MKWWHRWRLRVWEWRYFYALGKMETMKLEHGNAAVDTIEFADAMCERETAASAISWHREKAGFSNLRGNHEL